MTKEEQGAGERGEDVRWNAVKRFPDRVRDGVGPWVGGGRALSQDGGDLICGESRAVSKGAEDGGEWLSRLRMKKVIE